MSGEDRRKARLTDSDFQSIVDRTAKVSSEIAAQMACEALRNEMQTFRQALHDEFVGEAKAIILQSIGAFRTKELLPFWWKITKTAIYTMVVAALTYLGFHGKPIN